MNLDWQPIECWDTNAQRRSQRAHFPIAIVSDGVQVTVAAVAEEWIDLVQWGMNGHDTLGFRPTKFQLLPPP